MSSVGSYDYPQRFSGCLLAGESGWIIVRWPSQFIRLFCLFGDAPLFKFGFGVQFDVGVCLGFCPCVFVGI